MSRYQGWKNLAVLLQLTALALFLDLLSGCHGHKLQLHQSFTELKINEGEALEITCNSSGLISFKFPDKNEDDITRSDNYSTYNQDGKIIFRKLSSVFGDTGWYNCTNTKYGIFTTDFEDSNGPWMYVYVKSNKSAFVQSTKDTLKIKVRVGDQAILPCRPTSPELNVTLKTLDGHEPHPLVSKRISFDPKWGFIVEKSEFTDSGNYTCQVNQDGFNQKIDVDLLIIKKEQKKPVITIDGLKHVVAGSTLNINCKAEIEKDNSINLSWATPRDSNSREIHNFVDENQSSTMLVTSKLILTNITYDDAGYYTCKISSLFSEDQSTDIYIKIHDPTNTYINLTHYKAKKYFVVEEGSSVTFTANIDANPMPTLQWLRPNNDVIKSEGNYIISNTTSTCSLVIKKVKRRNSGIYALGASNGGQNKHLIFRLKVQARMNLPLTHLLPVSKSSLYYTINKNATFKCTSTSYPQPNITWTYKRCPKYDSTDGCETSELKAEEVEYQFGNTTTSKITVNITMFGQLKCTACDPHRCNSREKKILIIDVESMNEPFKLDRHHRMLYESENVTVTCTVVNYEYSNVRWLKKTGFRDSREPIDFTWKNTTYMANAIFSLKNVKRSDQGNYYCTAWSNHYKRVSQRTLSIRVHDLEVPKIIETNMNADTEIILFERNDSSVINLWCNAKGSPYPNITWYKDGTLLNSSKQFSFEDDNQKLTVNYILESDSGIFSCLAKNRFGEARKHQKLVVKGARKSWFLIAIISSALTDFMLLLMYFWIKIRHEKMKNQLMTERLIEFEEGALHLINPELSVQDQAELLPYDKKWEFPKEKLKFGKQLGSGEFGVVIKATAYGICAHEDFTTVAVKTIDSRVESIYLRLLERELKIMTHLGNHLNVVNLLGACTTNIVRRELLIIVEYCRYGNLHDLLLRYREKVMDQINTPSNQTFSLDGQELNNQKEELDFSSKSSYTSSNSSVVYSSDLKNGMSDVTELKANLKYSHSQPGWQSNYKGDCDEENLQPIGSQDLLFWAFQVAHGMEYLSKRKVIHADLAARNILLAENNIVKICDFGLAKMIYQDGIYRKQSDVKVPVAWMAIESIRNGIFSSKSDVWSFGVVLWEFFTFADTPYPKMGVMELLKKLIRGYRMEKPVYASSEIYDVMLRCWSYEPNLRPSFTELINIIDKLLGDDVKNHYKELNNVHESINKTHSSEEKYDYLAMMSSPDHPILLSTNHE